MATPQRQVQYFPLPGDLWAKAEQYLIEVAPSTGVRYRSVWGRFRDFLNGREPSEELANTYLSRRFYEVSPRTLGVDRAAISLVLNRVLRLNARLIRAKVPKTLPRVPDRGQQVDLMDAIKTHEEMALFALLLGAGLRIGEVLAMRWGDISWTGWASIMRKGGQEQRIPLKDTVLWALSHLRRKPGQLLFKGGYNTVRRRIFDPVMARAGLRGFTPHSLRHAAGTAFYEAGWDLLLVKEALGHKDISTTQIYTHLAPEKLRERLPDILKDLASR